MWKTLVEFQSGRNKRELEGYVQCPGIQAEIARILGRRGLSKEQRAAAIAAIRNPDHKRCPLGIAHPPNGVEHGLGCALCMNVSSATSAAAAAAVGPAGFRPGAGAMPPPLVFDLRPAGAAIAGAAVAGAVSDWDERGAYRASAGMRGPPSPGRRGKVLVGKPGVPVGVLRWGMPVPFDASQPAGAKDSARAAVPDDDAAAPAEIAERKVEAAASDDEEEIFVPFRSLAVAGDEPPPSAAVAAAGAGAAAGPARQTPHTGVPRPAAAAASRVIAAHVPAQDRPQLSSTVQHVGSVITTVDPASGQQVHTRYPVGVLRWGFAQVAEAVPSRPPPASGMISVAVPGPHVLCESDAALLQADMAIIMPADPDQKAPEAVIVNNHGRGGPADADADGSPAAVNVGALLAAAHALDPDQAGQRAARRASPDAAEPAPHGVHNAGLAVMAHHIGAEPAVHLRSSPVSDPDSDHAVPLEAAALRAAAPMELVRPAVARVPRAAPAAVAVPQMSQVKPSSGDLGASEPDHAMPVELALPAAASRDRRPAAAAVAAHAVPGVLRWGFPLAPEA